MCTCARAAAPRMWGVLQQLLYATCIHTKFQPNRTSSFGDTKEGCARAHVRQRPKSESRVTISCMIPVYIQSFSPIGSVASEIRKRGVHVRTCGNTQNLRGASLSASGSNRNLKVRNSENSDFRFGIRTDKSWFCRKISDNAVITNSFINFNFLKSDYEPLSWKCQIIIFSFRDHSTIHFLNNIQGQSYSGCT